MKQPNYFRYQYDAGPLTFEELSKGKYTTGNCRRALQDYLYFVCGYFLNPEQILLPDAYHKTGNFITDHGIVDFSLYKPGDIVYSQRLKDKNNHPVKNNRADFDSDDQWIYHFHSAVYIGDHSVYHATSVTDDTCVWNLNKFSEYYKIIAVKRILENRAAFI